MATPASRILVLYIDAAATDGQANAPALDKVAQRGCAGFLILPERKGTSASENALHALLGVDRDAPNSDGSFPYPKLPIALLSDSPAACESAKALGIADVQSVTTTEPQEAIAARLETLLQPREDKTKQLVVFHLTHYRPDHWVFAAIDKLLGAEETASAADCFVSVVRTASRPHVVDANVATHPLRPRQSYERHHGKYTAPDSAMSPPQRLIFASVHGDRTRQDLATRFDEEEIEARGAYGAMDARIFMKELAFRLGFAPKYGA